MKLSALKKRGVRGWTIVAILLSLLTALAFIGSSTTPVPYDPESAKPNGTKAFSLLLQRTGAAVVQDSFPHGDVAILMNDNLTQRETDDVDQWVLRGGTLIVADPYSSLQRSRVTDDYNSTPDKLTPACEANFLNGVLKISPTRKHTEIYFEREDNASVSCFPAGSKAFYLQAGVVGQGRVIDIGGADIFTNDRLDKDDNSVLLMNLVNPGPNSKVTLLETRDVSPGAETASGAELGDLINRRVKAGFWMLVTAALFYMLWRARRLGAPIEEEPLVRIPASQLVLATGDLLELANQPAAAASMIRSDFKSSLSKRFGFRANLAAPAIAELVSQRTGIDQQRLFEALREDAVINSENLVAYAQHVERLHQEVKRVR